MAPVTRHNPVRAGILAGIVSASAYAGFLAWDTQRTLDAYGDRHGPYEPWQVIGLVVVLGTLGFLGGLLTDPRPVVGVATVVITLGFSASAIVSLDDQGLWPVGAGMVAVGTATGMSLMAALGSLLAYRWKVLSGSRNS